MLGPRSNPVNSLISRCLQRGSQDARELSSRNERGNDSDGEDATERRNFEGVRDSGKAARPAEVPLTIRMSLRFYSLEEFTLENIPVSPVWGRAAINSHFVLIYVLRVRCPPTQARFTRI